MAKKKSAPKQESPDSAQPQDRREANPECSSETSVEGEATESPALDASTLDASATPAPGATVADEEYTPSSEEIASPEINGEDAPTPDDQGSHLDGTTLELPTTGELTIDESFSDDQVLGRLRASLLSQTELYREAQLFGVQHLDLASMLHSDEPVLLINTLDILRIVGLWSPDAVHTLWSQDEQVREHADKYLLSCLKNDLAPSVDLIDDIVARCKSSSPEEASRLTPFTEKLRACLVILIAQAIGDPETHAMALSRLCAILDIKTVERMLCDPSPQIRIAIIKSLATRPDLGLNTISIMLILLKDRDPAVSLAVLKVCSRLKSYPELVIPQILPLLPSADSTLHEAITDVLRCYGDATIEPVMTALEDTSETMTAAVPMAIALAPQRYTDALLSAFQSVCTRDYVRDRIAKILHMHQDLPRRAEIARILGLYSAPTSPEYPEWVPPKPDDDFLPKATSNLDFYSRLLDDTEIAAFSDSCTEDAILRLMADASKYAQINAMHVISHRREASAVAIENIAVWMKSSDTDIAIAAMNAWFAAVKDIDAAAQEFVEALAHCDAQDTQVQFLNAISHAQPVIDAILRVYFKMPRRCIHIVGYFLNHDPSPQTIQGLLKGIDRSQSVACIAETLCCLFSHKLPFDNHTIRPALLSLIHDPISFGQHGFMTRLFSLNLLRKYLLADTTPDTQTLQSLQAFHKTCKNAELRQKTKTLLKDLGEEIFDLEDDEDDFEDLEDEEKYDR